MSLQAAAQHLASRGRGPDTQLVHMAPQEVAGLQALAKAHGGTLTLNPDTGLPEAGFLKNLLPTIIGFGIQATTGIPAWAIGLGVGGLETARTGSLGKGMMAGLGAYGGAGLAGGLSGLGANEAAAQLGAAGEVVTSAMPDASALDVRMLRDAAPAMQTAAAPMQSGLSALAQPGGIGKAINALGGGAQAAKYGLAAAAPIMADLMVPTATQPPKDEPNPYQFAFDWERPSGPSYDSREAAQLRGRLRPITQMAEGGPVGEMSQRNEALMLMANGGQMFAEGGKAEAKQDVAKGMTGASADAFRYLMGQSSVSPATQAAQNYMMSAPAPTPMNMPSADTNTSKGLSGLLRRVSQMGDSSTPVYSWDPMTRRMATISAPQSEPDAYAPVDYSVQFAAGGLSHLGDYSDGGRLLKGPGDGVSDSIPAMIGNKRPARLADGEFVVPARIVSELGNGSTEAGARKLYAMMDRIQKARGKTVGKDRVAVNSRADKALPA